MRVAVVASAQIFGGFQNLPPLQSLDFPAFFGLSHLFPPRPSISVIFDTDLVTAHEPSLVLEGLDSGFPAEWSGKVIHQLPELPEAPSAHLTGFRSFLGGLLGGAE